MAEYIFGGLGECVKGGLYIRKQEIELAALMIMGDHSSRDAPEPLNAVGIGIIGRRVDQVQVLLQLGKHATHEQGTRRSVGLEIVSNHDGDPPTTFRARHSGAHLLTKHISRASRSGPAIKPALSPVHQTEAIDLAVVSRSLDQALPTPPFAAPHPREGRMKGQLDLILEIEVGS